VAVSSFKPISWQPNEVITEGKMDRMSNNDNWLRSHRVEGLYRAPGARHNTWVKMASGYVIIPASKRARANNEVYFGEFFSPGCHPIVTTGIISQRNRLVFLTVNGFGKLDPDRRGFKVFVRVQAKHKKNQRIARGLHIHWTAVGY